ncbi:hypothetical protein DFJ43DRAFT_1044029 [Lentinula guzmanii]|uniref:RRM domain-containing protein n=1 Tax=Lentinula guzmanii TaxID=2804957 RepID=A0AA38JA01_9AGAR|nr:hypothetical protein DFJ43DRAFT_1044029 [Lentinula guzmanii]
MLSPYPPTNPPTPLPPPSALPRLVKHLPIGFGDSALCDLFRPYGALASVRIPTHFGPDTGMIEFWNEDDARFQQAYLLPRMCNRVEFSGEFEPHGLIAYFVLQDRDSRHEDKL